jgi:ubiquinone/menaquinone biosynthesis C-methylase UbiE
MTYRELNEQLDNIDLYLLDMILKGRFENCKTVLDAGCGEGRNMRYLVSQGMDVHGIDVNPAAIQMVAIVNKGLPDKNFVTGDVRQLPYDNARFDAVICSAVLHFADSREDFIQMWTELLRVTKKSGLIFIRMSSNIGLNGEGTFPYNLTPKDLDLMSLETEWVEPFKTVLVEERSMAVIILQKRG